MGAWNELSFDAKVERFGLTWYRIKGGFGGRSDREDWVADVPATALAVHDYHWNGESFGANHGSFNGAIKAESKIYLAHTISAISELESKLKDKRKAMEMLKASIKKARVKSKLK